MPAQPIAEPQGALEVHLPADLEVRGVGADGEGLGSDVKGDAFAVDDDGGEADAVDGDAVAQLRLAQIERCFDDEALPR